MRRFRYSAINNKSLSKNAGHQFAATHALCHYKSETIYSFIPKVACSTMRVSMAIANGCISGPEDYIWIHQNNATFRASLRDLATAKFTFVILRDPLARLVSVYLDKIVDRTPVYWSFDINTNRQFEPDSITFRLFVEELSKGQIKQNIHWRPQVDFLVYKDYDLWIPLERFSQHQDVLQERTGIIIHDARQLTKHGNDQYQLNRDQCFADISPAEIRSMRRDGLSPDGEKMFDDRLRKIAQNLYEKDIELYGSKFGSQLS
ncbi:MAG: sulfotransferase family 2 domain-containing protein [Pseudomonadota bacterium]